VFIKDAVDLRVMYWNKASEELFGYSREDVLGKNDYDFLPQRAG
jgi:PAS domain S-box-containing protein